MQISEGIIKPHELREFLVENFFEPNNTNPFEYFADKQEEAIQHVMGVVQKIDKDIRVVPQNIIDAFCLNSSDPVLSIKICDKVFLPFGFTPQGIRVLNPDNYPVIVAYLYQVAIKKGLDITKKQLLSAFGMWH